MKSFNLILIALLFTSCTTETQKSNEVSESQVNEIKEVKNKDTTKPYGLLKDSLTNREKVNRIKQQLKTNAEIKVITFYEEQLEDFFVFDYAFKVLSDSSEFHKKYFEALSFDLNNELEYASYDSPETWEKTADSIKSLLKNKFDNILNQWIPIHYYENELTFYNPGDFNGGYYLFTDSLIYDNSFMDGPYIYKYESIDSIGNDIIKIDFKDVQSNDIKTMKFYFVNSDMAVIKHEGKFIDNVT
ncbi:hypothetical protein GCM10011506_17320 [Marivirga lumbricoides]|uniref:Lipoprotein n=1 Tax=Marivirga lumbricoides TaxID=1046115 RepID=A0ABQ1M2N9_9BACT|nr:hypothetical protein GCM10011506_17320 [Marivirga lumbricoides]